VVSLAYLGRKSGAPGRPERMPGKKQQASRKQMTSDIRVGFRWLHRDKHARIAVALMAGTTLIAQALIMIFLAEAHAQQLSTAVIGVVLAASGAGGVLGSVAAGWLLSRTKRSWLQIQMGAWSVALAFLAFSGGSSVLWTAIAMIILGLTGAIGNVEFGTYLVEHAAADGMLARVTSIGQVLAIAACALGPVLGGTAIQRYGAQGAVLLLLALVAVFAFISLGTPEMRAKIFAHVLMPVEWSVLTRVAIAACCRAAFRSCRGSMAMRSPVPESAV
jgi:predicted MFS family arabinose efflux permease